MNDVRRAVVWLAALAALVFLGDRLLSRALEEALLRSQIRFSRLYAGNERADVLVLGDSRAVNAVYTPDLQRETGLSGLSLAYNRMSMHIAESLLADYLERNPPPRLVVIEVTCIVQSPLGLMTDLKTYSNVSPRMQRLAAEANPRMARASRVLQLLTFNSELFLRALYYLRRSDQEWANRYSIPPAVARVAASEGLWRFRAHPQNVQALQRAIRTLRSRGIETRLVIGPYLPSWAARSANLRDVKALVTAWAREADPHAVVWDYTTSITDTSAFADRIHLNVRGSRLLLQKMRDDGFFRLPAPRP